MIGMGIGSIPQHTSWAGAILAATGEAAHGVYENGKRVVLGNKVHFEAVDIPAHDVPAYDIPASRCGGAMIPAQHVPAHHMEAYHAPAQDVDFGRMSALQGMKYAVTGAFQRHTLALRDPEAFKRWNEAMTKFQNGGAPAFGKQIP